MTKGKDRREQQPKDGEERPVLKECERRFKVAEARLEKHDEYLKENGEKTTEALTKIEGLTDKVGENTEEVKGLTHTIGALNTHLEGHKVRFDERSGVAGYLVKGVWMLVIGLLGSGATILFQEFIK